MLGPAGVGVGGLGTGSVGTGFVVGALVVPPGLLGAFVAGVVLGIAATGSALESPAL